MVDTVGEKQYQHLSFVMLRQHLLSHTAVHLTNGVFGERCSGDEGEGIIVRTK